MKVALLILRAQTKLSVGVAKVHQEACFCVIDIDVSPETGRRVQSDELMAAAGGRVEHVECGRGLCLFATVNQNGVWRCFGNVVLRPLET